ncbi:Bor family protein [Pseudoalteromonas luteoviolacea]|uniref:Lipoprotein bor n=1 Tax=Pseudoalteromonas luteoviolacea H33 TaxID=1365251 RepID=A0A167D4C6_9GAMM|nr:Bor family protein [Pseudoalteromonas luteoviolacea]KZN48400.1 hypothetical protein N476_21315 [Pseudoalteromonas luteoviolacea H33]KZN73261.1 hypothetical protein N477_23415 [Pseudoalteromonas luteoviolacea H33-S]
MKTKVMGAIFAASLLSGCAAQTFNVNGSTSTKPTVQETQTFFISGLGQEQVIDAAAVCNGAENVIKVEAQHTFLNGLASMISFGLYTPRDAKVYCKA